MSKRLGFFRLAVVSVLVSLVVPDFLFVASADEGASAEEETAFTNAGVLALCKAGMGDELVVAKIQQAPSVDFQLETEQIIDLREQGVSEQILKAMLERTSNPVAPATPPPPAVPSYPYFGSPSVVSLSASDGDQSLKLQAGSVSSVGFAFVQIRWLNISGLHSAVRTRDAAAAVIVQSDIDPANSDQFVLVRFEIDQDDKVRSFKLEKKAFKGGVSEFFRADKDFIIRFNTSEVSEGRWRLEPDSELEPGEYGLVAGRIGVYDFGVD